ncbi:dihydrolipoyl dehydrogenase [Acidovorax sp. SD340]|uniref:dihydrolipoyl dehydrogenase n=1 Tax=Acidovorax sp. SD340 TaxID=1690268 RepID=UPI0006DD1FC8|nr:dihydrolipoyl dehydrogenase [Acidovorax sp. SD340]KQB60253.1 dihydrolipoamide dehydrogenase [Acidovorax sp. SD340]MBO1009592.1 dihydrolipoyl dehydrogenase [Acidovorax sp. SD340]
MTDFDVIIIGGGPGGYQAAIRGAQLGMRIACVEDRPRLGGTCLNVGCIPSKALLESSERYLEARTGFAKHGIDFTGLAVNLPNLLAHKDGVVDELGRGIDFLFGKHKITRLLGHGRLDGPGRVVVHDSGSDAKQTIVAKHIVIATGSKPSVIPGVEIDEERIVSSTGALGFPEIPKHLVVIGGGYIGLELGSVWHRLGSKVTVVEYLDRITPGLDTEMATQLFKILQKAGFNFMLSTKVTGARQQAGTTLVDIAPVDSAKPGLEPIPCDAVLVSVGRKPNTEGLALESVNLKTDAKGFIPVDLRTFATSTPGIYAIGDVIGGAMLAHKASEEGIALMEMLAGQNPHVNYNTIPSVIYTAPEVASVGQTEEALRSAGVPYKAGRFPFSASARAKAKAHTAGLVKVLAHASTDEILGVHIIGPEAGSLIHEAVVAMEFRASSEDIARCCHAHPTLPEALREAALAVEGRALHV